MNKDQLIMELKLKLENAERRVRNTQIERDLYLRMIEIMQEKEGWSDEYIDAIRRMAKD